MSDAIDSAYPTHAVAALRFLLRHMTLDVRRQFMAELPLTYAALFPHVPHDTIAQHVRERLVADAVTRRTRAEEASARALGKGEAS